MTRKPKRVVVLIDWVDSTQGAGWQYASDFKSTSGKCRTIGWVVKETKDEITLAGSVCDLDAADIQTNCRMTIPKVAIVKMQRCKGVK